MGFRAGYAIANPRSGIEWRRKQASCWQYKQSIPLPVYRPISGDLQASLVFDRIVEMDSMAHDELTQYLQENGLEDMRSPE